MMQKVLLIYPVTRSADTMEHLGLGYVASALRKEKYTVSMLVYYVNEGDENIFAEIEKFQPDVVGFTTFTESMRDVLQVSKKIKNLKDNIQITFGGHAAMSSAEEILKDWSFVDYITVGDGELSFVSLMKYLDGAITLEETEGVVYRGKDGEIQISEIKSECNMFKELMPARDIYEQLSPKPVISLLSTSRGCLGRCAFCNFSGKKVKGIDIWRGKEPEKVVDEIEHLVNDYGMNTFFITDPTFEDPGQRGKERIKKIAEDILRRNLKINFEVHIRAENWHEEDKPLLDLLVKAGLESVVVGIESGSEDMLRAYDKRATVEDNIRIVKILKNSHISLEYGFIMFNPYTRAEHCYENLEYFKKTDLGHNIKCILTKLEVYPGVGIERKLKRDGLLLEDYGYLDSIFKYKYVDPEIGVIADALCDLPNQLECIDEMDLVNARIRVFMSRLWRNFGESSIKSMIEELQNKIDEIAHENMLNNVVFVEKCLAMKSNWNKETFDAIVKEHIEDYMPIKIKQLKNLEFEFVFSMRKEGMDVSKLQL